MTKKDLKRYSKKYQEACGMDCPVCGASDLDTDPIQADGSIATCGVKCLTCNSAWTDLWVLKGICSIDVSEKGKQDERESDTE